MQPRDPTDVLYRIAAIAAYAGMTERQAKHRAATGDIPTFKMGRIVCALKSEIDRSLAMRSAAAQSKSAGTVISAEDVRHG